MSAKDLSTSQVAERFNVTAANVRLWCQRGLLPNAYVRKESRGDVWMIPEGDLTTFEPPKKTGRPRKAEAQEPPRRSRKKPEAKP
jgi:1,2-phenylacetyl-CoA epoxidase PaaB subunit